MFLNFTLEVLLPGSCHFQASMILYYLSMNIIFKNLIVETILTK